ncbi:MAG: di-heme enzyme, partial [Myxococcales bacterium]|nr:di-heme enzyme [Myxococcales bacterium]
RFIMSGENAGDGRANPNKNPFISGFELTEQERGDLLAFLRSLTDTDFVTNPEFADPFAAP